MGMRGRGLDLGKSSQEGGKIQQRTETKVAEGILGCGSTGTRIFEAYPEIETQCVFV